MSFGCSGLGHHCNGHRFIFDVLRGLFHGGYRHRSVHVNLVSGIGLSSGGLGFTTLAASLALLGSELLQHDAASAVHSLVTEITLLSLADSRVGRTHDEESDGGRNFDADDDNETIEGREGYTGSLYDKDSSLNNQNGGTSQHDYEQLVIVRFCDGKISLTFETAFLLAAAALAPSELSSSNFL